MEFLFLFLGKEVLKKYAGPAKLVVILLFSLYVFWCLVDGTVVVELSIEASVKKYMKSCGGSGDLEI